MKKTLKMTLASCFIGTSFLIGSLVGANSDKQAIEELSEVTFFGNPSSSISSSVAIPSDYNVLSFSGTVPSAINSEGATLYERYGDTKTQAMSILEKFKVDLEEKGLSLADVTYLRVYITPDPMKGNEFDYQGWFDAYAEYFDTENTPKVARSTVGVSSLVNSDWLIEIEADVAFK
ncbi:Rid family hydrolase [Alkalihalobacillus oceani]|uniref:Rid family hydrolase n=1 Tax=Halalkalibacter oceani TaxID=1653776 RepID=A0A9X2DU91_9BACI|nr:Rid family hydrolase [Halalkalibacter oceani]MCM3715632.1 Rid family hydrolase [Halalkalibacter oceani]